MKYGSFLIINLLAFCTISASNRDFQDLSVLTKSATDYVLTKMSDSTVNRRTVVTAGKLDPRLRLTACNTIPISFTPPGSRLKGNTTVGVRCEGEKPWSIYIPVKVSIFEKVVVTSKRMSRGDIIGESDIMLDEVDISRIRGSSFNSKSKLIGTKIKSNMKINQVIDSATICLICKGDAVLITANNSAVNVSMSGIALSDGAKGDKIRVQNNSSRRIVEALVTNLGTVKVGF